MITSISTRTIRGLKTAMLMTVIMFAAGWSLKANAAGQPELAVPFLKIPPVIDGKLSPGEWQYAAAISAFKVTCGKALADQQAVFYVGHDEKKIYVAMRSPGKYLVSICPAMDNLLVVGDDAMEFMVAPGAGEDIRRDQFPVYYFVGNALGMIMDTMFRNNLAEEHREWNGQWEFKSTHENGVWTAELAIPFSSFPEGAPAENARWTMNFTRTYYPYQWISWNGGALNYAENGGVVHFDRQAPAIRLIAAAPLVEGKAGADLEVANNTDTPAAVTVQWKVTGEKEEEISAETKHLSVKSGRTEKVTLGNNAPFGKKGQLTLEVTDAKGVRLFYLERLLASPAEHITVLEKEPPKPTFYFYPRYLPTRERLVCEINFLARPDKEQVNRCAIEVFPEGKPETIVLKGETREFKNFYGVWRGETAKLAEGKYIALARLFDRDGRELTREQSWFIREQPEWLKNPRGLGTDVIPPFTPLLASGREVECWGRKYVFGDNGLPDAIISQDANLLSRPMELTAMVNGKPVKWAATDACRFVKRADHEVDAEARMEGEGLRVEVKSRTEYDGLMTFTVKYGPTAGSTSVDRMRLCLPLNQRHALYYTCAPKNDFVPAQDGVFFESLKQTRNLALRGNFFPYMQFTDMDRGLAWCADSDKGWIGDDNQSYIEMERAGEEVRVWFNWVNQKTQLDRDRQITFGLIAGPARPRPVGWRGVGLVNHVGDHSWMTWPTAWKLFFGYGAGYGFAATCNLRPSDDPTELTLARDLLWDHKRLDQHDPKNVAAVPVAPDIGIDQASMYNGWHGIALSEHALAVCRGEWMADKSYYDMPEAQTAGMDPAQQLKKRRNLLVGNIRNTSSRIDYATWCFEQAVEKLGSVGFYDDCGTFNPVYDKDLGLGYIRDDGYPQPAFTLSLYRERWKRAAYVLYQHGKPNYLDIYAFTLPITPWSAWAWCGEGNYLFRQGTDYCDLFRPFERFAHLYSGRQNGQAFVVSLGKMDGTTGGDDRHLCNNFFMFCLLNDCIPRPQFGWKEAERIMKNYGQFRPWERDVEFHGYWQNSDSVLAAGEGIKLSYLLARGRALFLVGNVGERDTETIIWPDWSKFGMLPNKVSDLDGREELKLGRYNGMGMKQIKLTVPRHEMRMVLVSE